MNICAFDIGSKNFAYAVAHISDIPDEKSWDETHDWWNCRIMECADLSNTTDHIFVSLHSFLHQRFAFLESQESSLWTILIEQQVGFGSMINYKAIQIAAHVHAFFIIKYPRMRVIEYPSSLKTKTFGMRFAKKRDRKQWAIEKVSSCFIKQKDEIGEAWFNCFNKKDDISDCLLMIMSFVLKNHDRTT